MRSKHWMSYIEVDFTTVVVGVTLSARSRTKMAKQCQAAAAQANTKPRASSGAPTRPYLGQAVRPGRKRDSRQQDRIWIASSKRSHVPE
jgi:hypothetical protein